MTTFDKTFIDRVEIGMLSLVGIVLIPIFIMVIPFYFLGWLVEWIIERIA